MADAKAPYGDVPYGDPGYLDEDGKQASKSGKPGVKRYPLDAEHVEAAWSYINQEKNAGQYTTEQLSAIKGRVRSAMAKHGHDVNDGDTGSASRGDMVRDYPLEDLHIVRSAEGGDGRTVEAFAAVFNTETEIQDHQGHYLEVISPTAFNKRLSDLRRSRAGFGAVKVIFNHGRSPDGIPVERFMMPCAKPLSIEATDRGLLTRSRYLNTPLGNEVLELISEGAITTQSFVGKIVHSNPELGRNGRYRPDASGQLTTVHRTELGLREYGGVLYAAYEGAEVLGVRMSTPGTWEPDETDGTAPDDVAAAGEPPPDDEHSYRHSLFVSRLRLEREKRGIRRSSDPK